MIYFLIFLFFISLLSLKNVQSDPQIFNNLQQLVMNNYELCRMYASGGRFAASMISQAKDPHACENHPLVKGTFAPGIYHDAYLCRDLTRCRKQNVRLNSLFPSTNYLAPETYTIEIDGIVLPSAAVTYCGRPAELDIDLIINSFTFGDPRNPKGGFGFSEISVTNAGPINFYNDYIRENANEEGVALFYRSRVTTAPCDAVKQCYSDMGYPTFAQSPDGGNTYSIFIRDELEPWEVVCGAPQLPSYTWGRVNLTQYNGQ